MTLVLNYPRLLQGRRALTWSSPRSGKMLLGTDTESSVSAISDTVDSDLHVSVLAAVNTPCSEKHDRAGTTEEWERVRRWEYLTDANNPRNGYYENRRVDPQLSSEELDVHDGLNVGSEQNSEQSWQIPNARPPLIMSVTRELHSDSSTQTRLVLGAMSATFSSLLLPNGDTENMAVVAQANASHGVTEIVYRRVACEDAFHRTHSVTESGSASATIALLNGTASCHSISTDALLEALSHVPNLGSALTQCLPTEVLFR